MNKEWFLEAHKELDTYYKYLNHVDYLIEYFSNNIKPGYEAYYLRNIQVELIIEALKRY